MTPSVTQSNILQQLRTFLVEVLPDGIDAITGQMNRVPEPKEGDFVEMIPTAMRRLSTNVDSSADAAFTGSIAGTTMTITAVDPDFPNGSIGEGSFVYGNQVVAGTRVVEVLTGTGQIGSYEVAPSQMLGSRTLSAGAKAVMQPEALTIQLAFHTAGIAALDLATTVSALMRDEFAVQQFANQSPNYGVVPLYADDPVQRPFLNDQQQFEYRWTVDALLQANPVISVPQEFADSVDLEVISVEAMPP